jgi:alpha-L-arabinofuranosidase
MTISAGKEKVTLSIVNKDLNEGRRLTLPESLIRNYSIADARVINAADVHTENTFEKPNQVIDQELKISGSGNVSIEKHSVTRFVFQKK